MVMQEGQQQALYGCSGRSVRGWGSVDVVIPAPAAGEEVGENRPNKRPKQKKTPQRGLGVAQLEKIRLEEQQNGGVVVASASSFPSPFSPTMPLPPLPLPTTPFSGSPDLNPPASRSAIPSILPVPFSDLLVSAVPSVSDVPPAAPAAALASNGFVPPLLWNPLDIGPQDAEASNKAFSVPISFQESNSILQSVGSFEGQHQYWWQQLRSPLSSLPGNPSATLPFSGFKPRTMEPPSNQSSTVSKPPNVVEMGGMKRPWPFHLDAMADYTNLPSELHLPPLPFPRADERPTVNAYNNTMDFKQGSASLRDVAPSSSAFQHDGKCLYANTPEKRSKEWSTSPVCGGFLTLGASLPPPAPTPTAAPLKLKQGSDTHNRDYCPKPPSSSPAPAQIQATTTDNANLKHGGTPRSPEQLPFYSFLPMKSSKQEAISPPGCGQEDVGSLDLNLKL